MTKQTAIGAKSSAILVAIGSLIFPSVAFTQDTPEPSGVSIELSSSEALEGTCRISFLAQNHGAEAIGQAVYETVLFDETGAVALLTLLDFRDLPSNRPRVRQFQFDGLACSNISRVLINGAQTCDAADPSICIDGLNLSSRTQQELIG